MKTVEKELLKLWLFEVAKRCGGHFEKAVLKILCHFGYFPSQQDFRVSETSIFFHGDKLNNGECHTGVL